jgi:tryptophan-rich sensory protein
MKKFSLILLFFVLNFGALAIGGFLMNNGPSDAWYLNLNKAPWTPPGWFFGFAWTTIMVCFTFYMWYLVRLKNETLIWALFFTQWVLNISWNYIFFNQQMILTGLFVLSALTIIVGVFLFRFKNLMKIKSWFVAPYFVWLIVACSLNAYVLYNN